MLQDKCDVLELENATFKREMADLQTSMSSVQVEADSRVAELEDRLARRDEEIEDRVGRKAYDQFLGALSGMVEAYPDLDYSFLPQSYQDIIQEWRTEDPVTEVELVVASAVPDTAKTDEEGPSAAPQSTAEPTVAVTEQAEEELVAEVTEDPAQANE